MAGVTLALPDLALFSDPAGTRVEIPHLTSAPRTRKRDLVLVRFEGDPEATPFRGEGSTRVYDVTCRYSRYEASAMDDLLALLDLAHTAPDGRLQLRTAWYVGAGMDAYEVIVAGDVSETPLPGRAWDVKFTATVVASTVAV